MLMALLAISSAQALPFRSELNRANDLYRRALYESAEAKYNGIVEKTKDEKALFDLGDALYRQNKFDESGKLFEQITKEASDRALKEKAFYNLGNSQFRREDYQGAVNSYEQALKLAPNDDDSKYNLELAKKLLKMPKQNRPKQNNKQKNDKDKNNKGKGEKGKGEQRKQPQPSKGGQGMNKEDAERILQGLSNNEKHRAKRVKAGEGKNEYDW